MGSVEGNVTSNINDSGDLNVSWDCYADSDENTYTSKLRVDNWNKKTSQATIGISGNDRDNTLNAVDGAENIIDGGEGNDTLIGGSGVDTFNFTNNNGFGTDRVRNSSSDDILQFESMSSYSVDFSNFSYYKNDENKNLVIASRNWAGNAESFVIVEDYFTSDNKIDKVKAYNWSSPDGIQSLATLIGDDSALGRYDDVNNAEFTGTDHNDVLMATGGTNTIIAGKGSDKLFSKDGENTFVFNSGDGSDILYQEGGSVTLKFNNAKIEDLSSKSGYEKSGNDLLINYDGSNTLTVKDYYKTGNVVTKVIDSTGTEYNTADYFKNYITRTSANWYVDGYVAYNGTTGDDEIRATSAYPIVGDAGSDKIWGSNSGEAIFSHTADGEYDTTSGVVDEIHAGDGNDRIYAWSDTNVVYGDAGNDTIFVNTGQKSIISDSAGTADVLSINPVVDGSDNANYQNLHIVFNIDNSGNVDDAGLRILTNDEFELWQTDTNHADIKGINIVKDSSGNGGYNCIETFIDANDYEVSMSVIETVKNDITSWLTSWGYSSVSDVFENEKIDGDITILLGKFDITDKWQ